MRTIIDIRSLLESCPTGVPYYAARIARELVRLRTAENEYALFSNSKSADAPRFEGGLAQYHFRYPNKILNAGFLAGWPTVERLCGPADGVFLPNSNFIATKLPIALTVHDISFARFPKYFSPKQRAWHALAASERRIRSARIIFAVSEYTKNDLMGRYGIAEDRIVVTHPGMDEQYSPRAADATEAVKKLLGIHGSYLLFLGTVERRKNVEGVIAAFENVPEADTLVIAGMPGWRYGDIARRAARSPRADRIKFLGYVRAEDKAPLYAGAAAFVYPSFYEGFGLPPLEAMACGAPVVASHVASLPEVLGNAALLVDPHDTNAIAHAVRATINDSAVRERLRNNGIVRASTFTWNRCGILTSDALRNAFSR